MASDDVLSAPLALFPLQAVLFPGGRLGLKIFEARYLDLAGHCLRSATPFGVICLRHGSEAGRAAAPVQLEPVGGAAERRMGVVVDVRQREAGAPGRGMRRRGHQ